MSLTPPQDVFGVVAEKPAHKLAGFESPPTVELAIETPKSPTISDLAVPECQQKVCPQCTREVAPICRSVSEVTLSALYSHSALAKIWGIASRAFKEQTPPTSYPEYTEHNSTKYVYSSVDFWTSGFFPGCLSAFYERLRKYPSRFPRSDPVQSHPQLHPLQLQFACRWWSANLHPQVHRRDTHDLGFMIQPWAEPAWELDHDIQSFKSIVMAAHSLASRFNQEVGAIRSWDVSYTKRYSFDDPGRDFLVIIDNMMNLNLLYYVSKATSNPTLSDIATTHANTTASSFIRADNSTTHVLNFDQYSPTPGTVKQRLTNQGYRDDSCWARGQAWGIVGFAQCYSWTHNCFFLETSRKLADYFIENLPPDTVPFWDFDAAKEKGSGEPRDTSAALIAVYGMLLIHVALAEQHRTKSASGIRYDHLPTTKYLDAALSILDAVVKISLSPEARFISSPSSNGENTEQTVDMGDGPETIILNATINHYEFAPRRWADHGLVYADYYFLLVGNQLLEMGLA